MTDMVLQTQTLAQMLINNLGPLPEQINAMNMIYTLYYNPADWDTLKNKPPVIAAGNTQAEARSAIDVPSTSDLLLVATALAERLPAYTGASKIKVSAGSSPFTPIEIDMMATAVANSIAQRTTTGAMKVATAVNADEATTLAQLDIRAPAYTGNNQIWSSTGAAPNLPVARTLATTATATSIPLRGSDGSLIAAAVDTARTTLMTVGQSYGNRLFTQPAHTAKSADGTLTAAELLTEIIVVDTTTEVINLTLPLASALETALAAKYGTLAVGDAIKFKVINTSTAGAFGSQIVTNTGWTIIGSTDIGNWFYGEFIARRTGANAFTLYRA
jgi:hypothetical protein